MGELFPDKRLVGQPYSSRHPDIRMVKVSSVAQADSFYHALSLRHPEYRCDYRRGAVEGTYEVGVIFMRDSSVRAAGIREIHFVEAIKIMNE